MYFLQKDGKTTISIIANAFLYAPDSELEIPSKDDQGNYKTTASFDDSVYTFGYGNPDSPDWTLRCVLYVIYNLQCSILFLNYFVDLFLNY